jgi:protein transport protein SEC61 subunit alpha
MKPVISVIPEIEQAPASVTQESKQIWTAIVVLIYLLCCQIPLYGIVKNTGSDPFYWMRVILASNRGSLMELGISPLVTSSMIMQLLAGAKLIKVDQNVREEKELFEGAQKLIGIFIAFGQAFAYTWSGMYGPLDTIGAGNAILIILQLTFASVVTMLLDDIMTKGYGIGNSGTSLFIAINMAETVLWSCFSPISYKMGAGEGVSEQYEGSIIELLYGVIFRSNRLGALQNAFFRSDLTNISNLLATALVFLIVIFFQGFYVSLKLSSNKATGDTPYSIKLFYTSNIPIILQTALVSNLYFFSQMLYRNFKGSFITNIFGNWQETGSQGQLAPVGGLIYYITSPRSLLEALRDPIHTIIYIAFIIGICALFSRTWIEVSGQGPK